MFSIQVAWVIVLLCFVAMVSSMVSVGVVYWVLLVCLIVLSLNAFVHRIKEIRGMYYCEGSCCGDLPKPPPLRVMREGSLKCKYMCLKCGKEVDCK